MPALDRATAEAERGVGVTALVGDPVGVNVGAEWRVGSFMPPSAPDPMAARAARLEARLAVYAQYAAVVAEEAAAAVFGDEARRAALTTERGAAAEHFAELRNPAEVDGFAPNVFADALTDALHELRHQDAVDDALGRRLRALRDAAAAREAAARDMTSRDPVALLAPGGQPTSRESAPPQSTPRLDLRF